MNITKLQLYKSGIVLYGRDNSVRSFKIVKYQTGCFGVKEKNYKEGSNKHKVFYAENKAVAYIDSKLRHSVAATAKIYSDTDVSLYESWGFVARMGRDGKKYLLLSEKVNHCLMNLNRGELQHDVCP